MATYLSSPCHFAIFNPMEFISELKNAGNSIFVVFRSGYYFLMMAAFAFLMMAFSVLIINISLVFSPISPSYGVLDRIMLVFNLLGGLFTNNTALGIFIILTTSLLAGINVSLLFFKFRVLKSASYKEHSLGTSGATAGVLASSCSSCGISILSMLGVAGAFTFMPLGGLELGFLGIGLLLISIYLTSKSISKCEVRKLYSRRKEYGK